MFVCLLSLTALFAMEEASSDFEPGSTLEMLRPHFERMLESSAALPADRQALLLPLSEYLAKEIVQGREPQILFVCTHNSRRSQLSQFWATVSASYYGLKSLHAHSCGTTRTACNPRTVSALRRVGVSVVKLTEDENPTYLAQFSDDSQPVKLFSKTLHDDSLPTASFAAAFCCDDADQVCPHMPHAALRVPLHYMDPRVFDGKSEESAAYDERSFQIASEMLFVMRRAREHIDSHRTKKQ